MILYNVTIGVDKEIEQEWLNWITGNHIPAVMKAGGFTEYRFYKVLTHEDEATSSYCIQYFVPTIQEFQTFLDASGKALLEDHHQKFKDHHVVFQTLLEEMI